MTVGKRVVFQEKGVVRVEKFQVKEPGPNEVLIRSVCTLISSGTEGAFLMAMPNTTGRFPQYPGYSNAGIVESVGSNVTDHHPGDRVASWTGHASRVLDTAERIFSMPRALSFDEATFFALGSTSLQGIRKAKMELGESVAIIGQGIVGQLALQLAKLSGAVPLIAIDLIDSRLETSIKCGADLAINPEEKKLESRVREVTGGNGVNVVIEATGNPDAIPIACKLAGLYGRVVLLGSTRGETKINFYSDVHKKGIAIIGAHNSMRPRHESHHSHWTEKDDIELVLKLLDHGRLNVKHLIASKVSYQEAPEAYKQAVNKSVLGIVLDWRQQGTRS